MCLKTRGVEIHRDTRIVKNYGQHHVCQTRLKRAPDEERMHMLTSQVMQRDRSLVHESNRRYCCCSSRLLVLFSDHQLYRKEIWSEEAFQTV